MAEMNYLRGAFIAYEPDGYPDRKRAIPFRFNPESLSRQLSLEQGGGGNGAASAPEGSADGATEQSADASSGSLKQSLSVTIRFDFMDRLESVSSLPAELGVAPEIAALEDLLHPAPSESDDNSDGAEPVDARPRRPTVLFVWGRKRVDPVRITGMTINESVYNAQLNPVRAEVEVSLEVLSDSDAKDNVAVSTALQFTGSNRREMTQMFLDNTSSQGANILPL